MTELKPFYDEIQAHYDRSNRFYELFLDPTMTYSCGAFESEKSTHEEAQLAKIDMILRKADLKPGQRVLEVGFGWGSTMRRAAEQYEVNVVGLTLSKEQLRYVEQSVAERPPAAGSIEPRLQGWEEFDEPVDRIVSIEVFEHFRKTRYPAFFGKMFELLPSGGRLVFQTSLLQDRDVLKELDLEVTHEQVLFAKFIGKSIFPGGQLCEPREAIGPAEAAGFRVTEVESLHQHYPRTLDLWSAALEAGKEEAIELTSQEVYDDYMRYLTGCSKLFSSRHIDVMQFTCEKE